MNIINNPLISKLFKTVLWGVSLLFGTLFVCVSGLILLLLSGPIDLKEYKSYAEHAVQGYFPNSILEFESAHLKWDTDKWEFALHAAEAKIKSTTTKNKYKAPKLHASWPLIRVLMLDFYPTSITFKAPKIKVRHLHKTDEEGESDTEFLTTIQQAISNSPIEKIIITEATLDFETRVHGKWNLDKTNVVFEKEGDGIKGAFVTHIDGIGKITGNLYTRDGKPNKLQVAFKQLNPKTILTHPNFKNTPFIKANKDHLSDFNTHLSGVLSLYLKDDFILQGYKFNFECGEGSIKYAPYLPKAIALNSLKIRGECENDRILLKSIELDSPYAKGELSGTVDLSPNFNDPDSLKIDIKGSGKGLRFQDVGLIWPKGLSPIIREWIVDHIPEGNLLGVTINLKVDHNLKTEKTTIHNLAGIFLANNARLKYLDGMPYIENITAKAKYDKDAMTVTFSGGNTFGQKVTSGTVVMSDLQAEDQFIDINMNVEGPLGDALKIINVPLLRYADKYGLVPARTKGHCISNLIFKFPMEQTTTLDNVEIFVDATIKNAFLPKIVETPKVTLLKGDLKLDLTKKGMTIAGTGLLNKAKSNIHLQENFEDTGDWQRKLTVEGYLSETQFKEMGFSLGNYFKGKAPFKLNLMKFDETRGDLTASLDLNHIDLSIPEFRVKSGVGEKGRLSLDLAMAGGHPQKLKSLKLDCGKDLQFECDADFVKGTAQLNQLRISKFSTARDTYSGSVLRKDNGHYDVLLSGSYIDLESFIENRDDLEDSFLSSTPYTANIKFKKAEIKGKPFFTDMSAQLEQSTKGYVKSIDLKAEMTNTTSRKELCTLKLSTKGDVQNLVMNLEDLGTAIAAFGAESDLKGGGTSIKATREIGETTTPWEGEYQINNFEVLKAPLLARLLKIVSPMVFVEFFKQEKGLSFSSLKGGFMIKPEAILLKKSLAVGPSVGMTIQGLINRKDDTLNMSGTIIPLYMLNSIVSYIPIIGQILTGGIGEGVISISYTIKGSLDNPKIQANPLTLVTPGILKKMFDSQAPQK